MTKAEVEQQYWADFIVWCATAPEGNTNQQIFWLDHRYPTEEHFWEWVVKYKAEELRS